jgi:hypothetical protein
MNEQERAAYERAHQSYLATKARREALEGKEKKLFEMIEDVEVGRYSASVSEVLAIAKVYNNNAINSFHSIFCFGFIKGQRAEKAKKRRKK